LNTVLANMTEGVVILHPDGTVRTANSAFRALFDLPPQIQGRRLRDLTRHIEIREAEDNALLRRKTDTREVTLHEVPGQAHKLRVAQMSYAPLPSYTDRETGAVIVFHDISRIKQYEVSRREFVANVSHELRTPLSIFKGYLETLRTAVEEGDGVSPGEMKRILGTLQRHSERLNTLVEDLLMLSRLESGAMLLNFQEVRVGELLEAVQDDCRVLLQQSGIGLVCSADRDLPGCAMDRFRVEQVFYNLVDNALRHSESREDIEIGARLTADRSGMEFHVRDRGVGIPSEKLGHIFERFFRVERARSRERGGTGLGLSIVKHIIQAHGGRVWAESELGRGTVIRFEIPLRQPGAGAAAETCREAVSGTAGEGVRGGRRTSGIDEPIPLPDGPGAA
jgi:two-component system, OmpR family, phosphate regulon sensor histidine kinase PhoR